MNQKELRETRRSNAEKVLYEDSKHRNRVNLHRQNSERHEMKKAELCWRLEQEEKHYITEARFKERDLRADIFVLDTGEIWEIETSKQELADRKSEYPAEKTYIWPLWDDEEVLILKNLDASI